MNVIIDAKSNKETVWYGPHACEECRALIVRASLDSGGAAFDVPKHLMRVYQMGAESGNVDVVYPTVWEPHVHVVGGGL